MTKSGPAKDLVTYFGKLYREKLGEQYPPTWGRDMKMFGEWLEVYSEDVIKELLDIYFEKYERIYSIPFFKVRLGELVQERAHRELNKPKLMEDNESWRFG